MVFDQPTEFKKIGNFNFVVLLIENPLKFTPLFPEPVIFHILIILVLLNLLKISKKWDRIIKKWQKVEEILPQYEMSRERTQLTRKINTIAFVFFISALGLYRLTIHFIFSFCCEYFLWFVCDVLLTVVGHNKIAIVW